jgi:hypothetical protein
MKSLILDNPVDEHLKPVKDLDGTSTSIELSSDKIRVKDLEVTGTTIGIETGTSITVDSSLTDGSTNPVENNAVFDGLATKLNLSGGTMEGAIDADGNNITNVGGFSAETMANSASTINTIDNGTSLGTSASTLPTQNAVKSYVDANRRWSIETGGYRSNNNSSTTYYFQYRPNGEIWSNTDSSIASLSVYDSYASMLVAPYDGKVTKISVHGYANDTGATDPLKFYVFKGTPSAGSTSISLTQIGVTGTITPAALRIFVENTDISSSNTFSENDAIYVMYKKDSTSGNQDLYFSITVSGEYTT